VGAWVALGVATLYAVFAGWGLPAQRTVWMLLATTGLRLSGLRWPAHAVWLALVALIALFDPLALTQAGFWLSYVAVGLLYGVEPAPAGAAWRRWWHEAVSLQWRISLALAPMSLYFFQGFSLAGLWVNLWAIPWVTLIVTPLTLLGLLCHPLWVLAGWACGWFLAALAWAAQTPWALIEVRSPTLAWVVPATLLAMGVSWPGSGLRRSACAAVLLILTLKAWP
jgi:competence protein ComEC